MKKPSLYAEINLDSIIHNMKTLRSRLEPETKFMAVVKADAYGHGDIEVSRAVQSSGADYLGVARIEESVRLRKAGIGLPILVFCPANPGIIESAVENDLTVTIADYESALGISRMATDGGFSVKAHLKIDTGMGRIGFRPSMLSISSEPWNFSPEDLSPVIRTISLPGLSFEGIFTHFASSDEPDKTHTESQLSLFMRLITELENKGFSFSIRHAANSAAILKHKASHLDMVRAGIALYGLSPLSDPDCKEVDLVPAMSLKSRIIHLKKIPKDCSVSYGRTWTSESERIIATVPVGYADGYGRVFSSKAFMIVRGQKVPVTGRICMDLTMIDVTSVDGVSTDDEVVIFGRQGDEEVSASDLANISDTINYEIVSRLAARVQRFFIRDRA